MAHRVLPTTISELSSRDALVLPLITVCYHLLSDVPQGDYRTVLDKLIAADILRGRSGTGEERVLDLTEDSVRLLVLLDRAGAFGS